MEKMKRYPKLMWVSFALLIAALAMFWMEWITLKQPSMASLLAATLPELSDGSLSFAEGRSLMGQLSELVRNVNSMLGAFGSDAVDSAVSLLTVLNIAYQVLFFGSFVAVGYCIYARLAWHNGLKEAIYFVVFLGNILIMYFLMSQLNSIAGSDSFGFGIWGIASLVCGLLSEILWEEASFNTPNPMMETSEK